MEIPKTMNAMVLASSGSPLELCRIQPPSPGPHEALLRVAACGVCRTDLHVVDGDLAESKLPLLPGHEIVGTVVQVGEQVKRFSPGDRVGVPGSGIPTARAGTAESERRICARTHSHGVDRRGRALLLLYAARVA
jgi:D-arabinose 1-dehydrogenase-like Zn-dependent alcohol dehydrogenase